MVGVLRNGDGDCEREAVSAAAHEARRKRRRLDARAAATSVLLAHVLLLHELAREDVDLFALLCLTRHLLERATARSANTIGFIEIVLLDHDAQQLLLARAVSLLRVLRRVALLGAITTTLGALAEEHSILLLELRLQ